MHYDNYVDVADTSGYASMDGYYATSVDDEHDCSHVYDANTDDDQITLYLRLIITGVV